MTATPTSPAASQQAAVDAALLTLERLGLSPDDLTAAPRNRAPVPTFADYVPVVSAAVTDGTRKAYGSYWNRVVEQWGARRLDEPTPSEIRQMVAYVKTHTVPRRNARGGRGAAENLIAALRCLYRHAQDDDLIAERDNPARKVDKPRRLPGHRRQRCGMPAQHRMTPLVRRKDIKQPGNGRLLELLAARRAYTIRPGVRQVGGHARTLTRYGNRNSITSPGTAIPQMVRLLSPPGTSRRGRQAPVRDPCCGTRSPAPRRERPPCPQHWPCGRRGHPNGAPSRRPCERGRCTSAVRRCACRSGRFRSRCLEREADRAVGCATIDVVNEQRLDFLGHAAYRVSEIRALTTLRNRVAGASSGHLRLVVGGQNQVAAGANMMRLAY
jgi:hypothetical protein